MRNLIQFFIRFHLLFLFIFLEAVSSVLIIQNNKYHQAGFLNASNLITGTLYEKYTGVTDYFKLSDINDSLGLENANLKNTTALAFTDHIVIRDSVIDTIAADLQQIYTFIPARVIKNSTNKSQNFIFLNRGSKHGVRQEMGIINQNGVVGVVVNVSKNYSMAMSVLHKDIRVSSKFKKNNYFGNLSWKGTNPKDAILNDIPKHIQVSIGDSIVTSGYSSFFPEGIPVGNVTDSRVIPGTNFLEIDVKLSTNFNNLSYVYIVDFLQKNELKKLETQQLDG